MSTIPTVTLHGTGRKMPLVGFGLWKVTNDTCADTVYNAIKVGYRLFDGAGDYGNEKEAGDGIQRAISEGIVKREDLFITSKLWNTFHRKDHVKQLAKKQLADYRIDYFDLFLVHFPISQKYVDPSHRYPPMWWADDGKTVELDSVPMQETWFAMEGLVEEGLAKNIGLSNCQGSLILDVLRYSKIPPAVLQIEHHPYLTQAPLVDFCKQHNIAITGYSSFGPQSFIELEHVGAKSTTTLFEQDVIKRTAQKHNKTPAQVLLRWAIQRGIAVIPKSNDVEHLKQNFQIVDFELSDEEIKTISGLNRNLRFNDPSEIDPRLSIFA